MVKNKEILNQFILARIMPLVNYLILKYNHKIKYLEKLQKCSISRNEWVFNASKQDHSPNPTKM